MLTKEVVSNPHATEYGSLLRSLETDQIKGLSKEDLAKRVQLFGINQIQSKHSKSALRILFNQVNNILTYILIIAILLSLFAGHTLDSTVILILLVVNIVIGFILEYKAEKRVESLHKMVEYNCLVIRDGIEEIIDVKELVPGDIVKVEEGEVVPADIRVLDSDELSANESALTGESLPVEKNNRRVKASTVLAERKNMLYMGTYISSGLGTGVVVGTGSDTEIGEISQEIDEIEEKGSLFYIRTEKLMRKMIYISAAFAVLTVLILVLRQAEIEEIIQFSFAALISGIPEGLPSILTVLLSIASVRLAKKNALLRNLPAIETLSTATTVITDKTGTLTQNVMSVNELLLHSGEVVEVTGEGWSDEGEFLIDNNEVKVAQNRDLVDLLKYLAITSDGNAEQTEDGYELIGYPTEIARYVLAKKGNFDEKEVEKEFEVIDLDPYDQETKYKSILLQDKKSGNITLVVVGGAERVLGVSQSSNIVEKYVNEAAGNGYRMQVISTKQVTDKNLEKVQIKDLEVLAALRITDPLREDVPYAIDQTKGAGIRIIMATGDHLATAVSIGKEAGLIPSDIPDDQIENHAISQSEIDKMNDQQFSKAVEKISIFARVTPSTKIRIAKELHKRGEIIAMTGDGVNDAPVLKQADIGIAMGKNGTDLARESSDLILMDDSFSTIVDGIIEGRAVYKNMKRTSLYLIITNLTEDLLILLALLFGFGLPLLPIQILWLNLVTDGVTDIALATEKPHSNILKEPPVPVEAGIVNKENLYFSLLMGFLMACIAGGFFLFFYHDLDKARSVAFTAMVFTQIFNVINMRALTQPVSEIGFFSNRAVNISIVVSLLLFLIAITLPFMRELLSFELLSIMEIFTILVVSSLVLWFGEVYKIIRFRKLSSIK